MKCRKCGQKAVINMRQHKLALCKDDYMEWLPEQTERFIRKYSMFDRHEKILVAVSGGKDSLSLWISLSGSTTRRTAYTSASVSMAASGIRNRRTPSHAVLPTRTD